MSSSLGMVLNGFIAAAVVGICVSGLFKRGRERRVARVSGSVEGYDASIR
ncbi:hypothetical protein [Catenulispora pinisilvae]|nr:hypothetical protein [Catenulispora pinisilvae]